MNQIQIAIPLAFNPLPHQNYIKHTNHGSYKDPKLAYYQQHLQLVAVSKKNEMCFRKCAKWFHADIKLTFKSSVHGDPDNCAKSILDAFEGVLYPNDKWCNDLRVRYGYGREAKIVALITESEVQ